MPNKVPIERLKVAIQRTMANRMAGCKPISTYPPIRLPFIDDNRFRTVAKPDIPEEVDLVKRYIRSARDLATTSTADTINT